MQPFDPPSVNGAKTPSARIDPPVTVRFCTIYEPTLQPDETRDEYLERFRRVNRPAWSFLTPEEWAQIDHHVTTCDLPETAKTWLTLGRETGFANVRNFSSTQPASMASTAMTFKPRTGRAASAALSAGVGYVRLWHIADIDADDEHVRFWGQSGHP